MQSTKTFNVRFILRYPPGRSAEALIYARISVNKRRAEFSVNRSVNPKTWDPNRQCVTGSKELVNYINPFLDDVRYKLTECFHQLIRMNSPVSAEAIKRLYIGEDRPLNTLMNLFTYHTETAKELLKPGTFKNYGSTEKYIRLFLKEKYRTDDILLCELNYQFISHFELFLKTTTPLEKSNPLSNNGIMKHMERLRKIVTLGYKMDWIPKDPFLQYKLRFQRFEREFLLESEISLLHQVELKSEKLRKCRDLFLFSCYTGLAYIDLVSLGRDNILRGIDGELWIKTSRKKTDTKVSVPLLPQAIEILDKYKGRPDVEIAGGVLPVISNQKMNIYLKEIAEICKINKTMTFHLARHTFATTVTLNNGIPLETVSKMLGHSKLSTTQIYVHVLERKISEDMRALKAKLSGRKNGAIHFSERSFKG
ncbi:MAG: site-specific integrase [Sphingobacteriales bacterium]|nr:site-specific integrase [Sphingobacteriales bacterium]